jgi:hypothetical protein
LKVLYLVPFIAIELMVLDIFPFASPRLSFTFSQLLVDDWKQGKAVVFELHHSFLLERI